MKKTKNICTNETEISSNTKSAVQPITKIQGETNDDWYKKIEAEIKVIKKILISEDNNKKNKEKEEQECSQ